MAPLADTALRRRSRYVVARSTAGLRLVVADPPVRYLVYGVTTLWAAVFATAAVVGQQMFLLRRYDLGNFTQAVWATAHGHLLEVTEVGGLQVSRLGIHVDPIIVLLVPLWWVWPSPLLLLLVQAVALAAGALPLFWLARKYLGSEREAGLVAAAYLLCPSIGWNAFHEFHAVAFAVPLLMFSIWFLDEGRMWAFSLSASAAMLCQEQIGALVAGLGLWYVWRTRQIKRGLAIAATGLAVSALDFGVVLRHFSGGSPYSGRYEGVGGSPSGIGLHSLEHPIATLGAAHVSDLVGIVFLALPVFGVCLRASLTLVATPQVAVLVLANGDSWSPLAQNALPLIPFIYAGTVLALASFVGTQPKRRFTFTGAHVVFASLMVAGILTTAWLFGSIHAFTKPVPTSSYLAAEQHAVDLVPRDAAVSATNYLGSHLAARRHLYMFPLVSRADWVVVESKDVFLPDLVWLRTRRGITVGTHDLYRQPGLMQRALRGLERSPKWKTVYEDNGISVFERRRDASTA
jgi:uncharacterized membrane protein